MPRPSPHEELPPSASDFEQRLRLLQQGWRERREVARLVHAGDSDSQLELLQRIHAWTLDCAASIANVYGQDITVAVSPRPRGQDDVSFVLIVAQAHRLVFSVVPRSGGGWRVSARSLSGGMASSSAVGPSRRDGSWTRARVEELILAQVAAVERARSDGEIGGNGSAPGGTARDRSLAANYDPARVSEMKVSERTGITTRRAERS
jgi:hypothetical protein